MNKKIFYLSSTIVSVLIVALLVYAYGGSDPTVHGHDQGELEEPMGSWTTISEDTVYQAATDGLVIGMIKGTSTAGGKQRIEGYTDSSNPPTTLRGYASIAGHSNSQWESGQANSFTMPVKKGDHYKVTKVDEVGAISSTRTYYWIPMGS